MKGSDPMDSFYHPTQQERLHLPFYIKCIGGFNNQVPIQRQNGYPADQLFFCYAGKGRLYLEGKNYDITKNMLYAIPTYMPHGYHAVEEPWGIDFIAYLGSGVEAIRQTFSLGMGNIYVLDAFSKLRDSLLDLYRIAKFSDDLSIYQSSARLYQLLVDVKEAIDKQQMKQEDSLSTKRIHHILAYIATHYSHDVTLDDLAQVIPCSQQLVCHLFQEEMHMRPIAYLNELRVQKAKELLLNDGRLSIAHIAKEVGFNHHSYFGWLFKKKVGMSPTRYRKQNTYNF